MVTISTVLHSAERNSVPPFEISLDRIDKYTTILTQKDNLKCVRNCPSWGHNMTFPLSSPDQNKLCESELANTVLKITAKQNRKFVLFLIIFAIFQLLVSLEPIVQSL